MSETDATDVIDMWPVCPKCGRRRHTECPACHTSGDQFAEVERAWEDGREFIRVLCPTCDEAFVPKYRPQCHGCGERFEPLLELPASIAAVAEKEDLTRMWLALGLMVGTAAVVGGYFAIVLRR